VAAATVAGLPEWFARESVAAERARIADTPRRIGPNDTIQFGAIGVGGSKGGYRQGLNDTHAAASKQGCKVIAVCDLDKTHCEEGAASFGADTARIHDFRELLSRKDIDAVVIGTPDHWHVQVAVTALRAGKDVYCEKPLTLTIDEGKKLTQVARQTGRVFQVGSQQRSDARFRLACELVRNGRLGKIKTVTACLPTGPTGGPFEPQPVPADFDFDFWLGPTPVADYFPERTHGVFRWFLTYSGGMMTDWGAHHNDIAQWGLGTDHTGPVSVQAFGKGPIIGVNCYNTFPEFDIYSTYANGVVLHTTNKGDNGVTFEGENGWIFVTRGGIKASDPRLLEDPLPSSATRLYASDDHMQNFVDCIRSRKETICPAEVGHRSATVCHLGNLSLRLGGRKLEWDPERQDFKNDHEAHALLSRPRRHPWSL
jgi:predicted dehydrogenase